MIDSAIVWKSSCNDIFSVVGYDSSELDAFSVLSEMVNNFSREYRVIESGDTLEFIEDVEENSEIVEYINSMPDEIDLSNLTLVVITSKNLIYSE